jgi:hypothetical protein
MAATVAKMLMQIDCSMVTDDPKRGRATLGSLVPQLHRMGRGARGQHTLIRLSLLRHRNFK